MKLQNDDYPFNEIFKGNIFKVPDYQRFFSWEIPQFQDLWKDLMNILSGKDRMHYMGTIICKEAGKIYTSY